MTDHDPATAAGRGPGDRTVTPSPDGTVVLPDAPHIQGLRFRRFRDEADYASLAGLQRAVALVDGDDEIPTAENLRVAFEHTARFDHARDLLFAEVDGQLVAYGYGVFRVRDGSPVHELGGMVHPDWRRRGLGRALLAWNERRARAWAQVEPETGGPDAAMHVVASDTDRGAQALLSAAGFVPLRFYFGMIRRGLDGVVEVPLPDGVQIRPVLPAHHRSIFEADSEAFRDHFGHHEATEQDFTRLFAQPDLDTGLWRVAWDGEEVAGSVQAWIWREENRVLGVRRGWLEHISVRRPWRRRGLARALIASALVGLREAGMNEAMLGVDSQNPTGALRLYESAGFGVKDRWTQFRKPLAS